MLLAGDIGGTKTVLAVFDKGQGAWHPLATQTFASGRYASLEAIISEFLATHPFAVEGASFGVAGPVVEGRAVITNLPWIIDCASLSQLIRRQPVHLLNDLEAIATGVPYLDASDKVIIHDGDAIENGPIAVVAPGTGLGEAYLVHDGQTYLAVASEGGHTGFGPESDLEVALLSHLRTRYGHVSCERVCSGSGLPNLYAFLRDAGYHLEPAWLEEELAVTPDPAPIISGYALQGKTDICVATMDLFVDILASEAANMALNVRALGGVYLGGGIPPRILPLLQRPRFVAAFKRKGRFASLLDRVPVYVILDTQLALHGAAVHGLSRLSGN